MTKRHILKTKPRLLGATIALALTALALPSQAQNVPRERTLIIMPDDGGAPTFRNPGQLNPYLPANLTIRWSGALAMEPLFYYNSFEDELVPWLATGYFFDDTFSTLDIALREGVTWSDGEAFDADDVVFTIEMLIENGEGAGGMLFGGDFAESVESVEAVDPHIVRLNLTEPDPRFPFRRLMNYFGNKFFPVPEHIWSKVDPVTFANWDPDKGYPVVTGAWEVSRSTSQQIVLDRRDDWWGAATGFRELPKVERLIAIPKASHDQAAQAILAGQVDMTGDLVAPRLIKRIIDASPNVTSFSGDEPPYGNLDWWPNSLYFNHQLDKWSDVRLRRAISYYVDAEELVDVAYSGASPVSVTPFPDYGALAPYIEDARALADEHEIGVHNPEKGDELMQEMGYEKNDDGFWEKDGQTIESTIHGLALFEVPGPILAQQLRDAGLDVEFVHNTSSRGMMVEGRTELAIFGHRGGIADPLPTLELYHCRNAVEVGQPLLILDRWCNEEYSDIVARIASLSPDDPRIRELVREALEIWYREAVEVPLNQWVHRIPYNTTYWINYPTEENPYIQPAFWMDSGAFALVMHNLEPQR